MKCDSAGTWSAVHRSILFSGDCCSCHFMVRFMRDTIRCQNGRSWMWQRRPTECKTRKRREGGYAAEDSLRKSNVRSYFRIMHQLSERSDVDACVLCVGSLCCLLSKYPNDSRLRGERAWQKFTFINHNPPLCAATSANLVMDVPELPQTLEQSPSVLHPLHATQTHNTWPNPYQINNKLILWPSVPNISVGTQPLCETHRRLRETGTLRL